MNTTDRRAAIAAYKERKAAPGIYALRAGDATWIGYTPDLGTVRNRLDFTLRMGSHRAPGLQDAWNRGGPDSITFETVERFFPDAVPAGAALKDRLAVWLRERNAAPL